MYRTAAAGRSQKEKQIERHSSVSLRAGFSFTVRKGANVSHRLRTGTEQHRPDRRSRMWDGGERLSAYRTATSAHHGQKFLSQKR